MLPKRPTASVPQMPQVRWTEMAPTGSSIFTLSRNSTEPTTIAPAIRPISVADRAAIWSAPAVIPTRPARMPFSAMDRSGFRSSSHEVTMAPTAPADAAMHVVTSVSDTRFGSPDRTEPPLNPNQPSHSRKTPMAASGMLLGRIGRMRPSGRYLPMRGPSSMAPANAPQPPTACTMVEPAKS